jgi:hypothetical protein
MTSPKGTLQESIARQRENLAGRLSQPLHDIAEGCREVWGDRARLDEVLTQALEKLPEAKFLYVLDANAVQVSDNISHEGIIEKDFGRDRSQRPYLREVVPSSGFLLSEAYISLRVKRPSLTAIQIVRDADGNMLGYVGADFDLRDLPLTSEHYEEPTYWRQIKGDPAIRGTVFHQNRVDSLLDRHIDEVLGVLVELMVDHGVFQLVLHFSSSRATIWTVDDPYRYRLLDVDALTDPDVCLAFPRLPYPREEAHIPRGKVRRVMEAIGKLRFMDEMFYLRSCSLNIFNGIVSLTFSCDGSHYLPYEEFLEKDVDFWVGGASSGEAS